MQSTDWLPIVPSHYLRAGDNIVAGFAKGEELALWRSKGGAVQAWENRCPHRGLRLTLGRILNDNLSCAYHGWEYSPEGRCAAVPANPSLPLPKQVRVRAYAVEERGGMVWVNTRSAEELPKAAKAPAVESTPHFCRSLGVRVAASTLEDRLASRGFASAGYCAWFGQLAGQEAALLINAASDTLTLVHVWLQQPPEARYISAVQAELRLMRRDLESSAQERRQA